MSIFSFLASFLTDWLDRYVTIPPQKTDAYVDGARTELSKHYSEKAAIDRYGGNRKLIGEPIYSVEDIILSGAGWRANSRMFVQRSEHKLYHGQFVSLGRSS